MNTNEMLNVSNAHIGNLEHLNAKRGASNFGQHALKYEKCEGRREKIVEKLGGEKPSAYLCTISFFIIGLCGVLAYAEMTNCFQSLVGIGFSSGAATALGIGVAILGLTAGHEMSAGAQEKKDQFTGKAITYTRRFYFGLALAVTYVGFQVFLILSAGSGGGMGDVMGFYTCYAIFLCLLEMLLGAKLHSAVIIVAYVVQGWTQKVILRKMKRSARQVEEWWQRFVFMVGSANASIPGDAETPLIKRARDFYNNGFDLAYNRVPDTAPVSTPDAASSSPII